jgi:ATPase subunit of ABC transporter with duplicated ATPase domains
MATLHVRDVSLSFGSGPVLADVSFTVAPGMRVGIVAPNGTGKSTLLRVLAGDQHVDDGTVASAPPDAAIGLLPQGARPPRR